MLSLFKKTKNILHRFVIDKYTRQFIKHCASSFSHHSSIGKKKILLVEFYGVDQTVLSFAYFANIFANLYKCKIISISLSNKPEWLSKFFNRRLASVYKAFNTSDSKNTRCNSQQKKTAINLANKILRKTKNKYDILKLKVRGDLIGPDIYEAYLREKMQPTLYDYDIHTKFKNFLIICLKDYLFWDNYFDKNIIKGVVLSHGIYRYGILKKIANRNKVPVYLPTARSLYCIKNNELGNPPFKDYPKIFNSLSGKQKKRGIEWARKRLGLRLSGQIGVDMSYSNDSAFRKRAGLGNNISCSQRLKVLIASHDFFDNPNAYGKNLFPDFYDWLSFLAEISKQTNYDWYIKTHPDVLPGNKEIIQKICAKFNNIKILNPLTSFLHLREKGFKHVLTCYGSVGHELPLCGYTVINAGTKNPHIGYNFNIHPKTIKQYKNIIFNLNKIHHKVQFNKIYEFYFIHHFYFGYKNLFFKSFLKFVSKNNFSKQNSSYAYYEFLKDITASHQYRLNNMIHQFIVSKRYAF